MNRNEIIEVASFDDAVLANIAKGNLEAEGISAYLSGEVSSTLWHVGTAFGRIRLSVASKDVGRAVEILHRDQPDEEMPSSALRVCEACGAPIDLGFAVCWSCGSTKIRDRPSTAEVAIDSKENLVTHESGSSNDSVGVATNVANEAAKRALISAIFGIICFPFTLYALYLLFKISGSELDPAANRQFYWAWVVVFGYMLVFWTVVFVIQSN